MASTAGGDRDPDRELGDVRALQHATRAEAYRARSIVWPLSVGYAAYIAFKYLIADDAADNFLPLVLIAFFLALAWWSHVGNRARPRLLEDTRPLGFLSLAHALLAASVAIPIALMTSGLVGTAVLVIISFTLPRVHARWLDSRRS